ncbi:MAG: DUF2490 domain-containing protein [Acidimicrobiia bacterium]|nr:DUF2490 domain-containing protein [Acidimicrobiia bacterium]
MRYLLPLVPLLTLPASLSATELFSWHLFDTQMRVNRHADLVIHSRVRTRDEFHRLQQARGGAIVRFHAGKNLIPYTGYYFQPAHEAGDPWTKGHRAFVGVERPFAVALGTVLITRIAAERHMNTGRPNYMRFRTYTRLQLPGRRVAPFIQNEWLAVKQGFHSVRNSGGLRIRLSPVMTLEAGYLYDIRRASWGGDRSAIVTALKFQLPER